MLSPCAFKDIQLSLELEDVNANCAFIGLTQETHGTCKGCHDEGISPAVIRLAHERVVPSGQLYGVSNLAAACKSQSPNAANEFLLFDHFFIPCSYTVIFTAYLAGKFT